MALEAKMLPPSDDSDDVIGRREVTKRPRHPASGQGNGSELLTGTESLMETPDEWSRPPICARIRWDCLCVRWVLAGTGVFTSPVMSVSLADPPVNGHVLECQRPMDNGPLIGEARRFA